MHSSDIAHNWDNNAHTNDESVDISCRYINDRDRSRYIDNLIRFRIKMAYEKMLPFKLTSIIHFLGSPVTTPEVNSDVINQVFEDDNGQYKINLMKDMDRDYERIYLWYFPLHRYVFESHRWCSAPHWIVMGYIPGVWEKGIIDLFLKIQDVAIKEQNHELDIRWGLSDVERSILGME